MIHCGNTFILIYVPLELFDSMKGSSGLDVGTTIAINQYIDALLVAKDTTGDLTVSGGMAFWLTPSTSFCDKAFRLFELFI